MGRQPTPFFKVPTGNSEVDRLQDRLVETLRMLTNPIFGATQHQIAEVPAGTAPSANTTTTTSAVPFQLNLQRRNTSTQLWEDLGKINTNTAPFANIVDYGADSTGVSDSTAAFAAAWAVSAIAYVPTGTFLVGAISVPTGKSILGAGKQKSILKYTGSGSCITIDGCQACTVADIEVQVTGGAGTERGITITNAAAGSQRNVIRNCYLLQNNATARIAGQKGIYIVDVNGGGAAQYWNHVEGCDFLNWDVACHLQKNGGTNGANQNFLMRNFFSSSLQHILIDGACNDNSVWAAHGSHSSASVFTDVVLTIGDGATVTAGNICIGIVSDMGANGSAFNVTAAATNNVVIATNESSGADVDASAVGNNFCMSSKNISGLSQRLSIPNLRVIGSIIAGSSVIFSNSVQLSSRRAIADANAVGAASDYMVAWTALTAARTYTLPANAQGKIVIIKDESGAASGVNTISAVGTVDGVVNPVLVGAAYGVARLYNSGTAWFTQ